MALPIKPVLTPVPVPLPQRGQVETVFTPAMNNFIAWTPNHQQNLIDVLNWIQAAYGETEDVYDAAVAARDDAADVVAQAQVLVDTAEQQVEDAVASTLAQAQGFAGQAANSADEAAASAQLAQAAANFAGDWANQSGAASVPLTVYYNGQYWTLLQDVASISAHEPSDTSTIWARVQAVDIVRTPVIIAPLSGATGVSPQPTLEADGYANIYSFARDYREFQIDLDTGDFSSPLWSVQDDADTAVVGVTLAFNTGHKWRCRDVAVDGTAGRWSSVAVFSTGAVSIARPTLTVAGEPDDVGETPLLETSAFSVIGGSDEHLNTDWQVMDDQLAVIWESMADAAKKTPLTVTESETTYIVTSDLNPDVKQGNNLVLDGKYVKINSVDSVVEQSTNVNDIFNDGSCVATYMLDNDATDLSGRFNGVITEGSFVQGKFNDGLLLDDAGTYSNMEIDFGSTTVQAFSMWVKSNGQGTSSYNHMFDTRGGSGGAYFTYNSSGAFNGTFKGSMFVDGIDVSSTLNFPFDGQWHHVVIFHQTDAITIGNRYAESSPKATINGTYDQIRFFNRTLTPEEISQLYNEVYELKKANFDEISTPAFNVSVADAIEISVPAGILQELKTYTFRARHRGKTYGVSPWHTVVATTKEKFGSDIGEAGGQGFGVGVYPAEADLTALGLAGMAGYTDPASPNYGNYIHTNGSVMVFVPKFYYRIGNAGSPRFGAYGLNSIDISGAEEAGYVLHRAFIDGGSEKHGFFIDKYLISKNAGNTAAVSVKNGVPISLIASSSYTNSNGFLGGTGILADAVLLCRSRGDGYNQCSAFMYGALALLATAHAQSATSTTFCAWYDPAGVTNFVKGCNNNALSDVNDTSIKFTGSGESNKPRTGSAVPFAKTTHNGQECGIADLNGAMWEPALGVTSPGTSATSATRITNKTFYLLKHGVALKDLTAGWNTGTDAWGNTAHIQSLYDSYTAPTNIGADPPVYWGNGSNQVFSGASTGVNYEVEGFMPLNDASMSASGTNQFGNDYYRNHNVQNMFPLVGGSWTNIALAGLFSRFFTDARSYGDYNNGCRGSAYAG